ncbi:hypothetical protein [Dermacoccus abyssi]|uniref:hypothetical protein n=1 Tax=Dermacoccus abyssi TaxID=322596 RepID=UPI002AD41632|nr:hypothetical protein [Dermacoccus abyssi]
MSKNRIGKMRVSLVVLMGVAVVAVGAVIYLRGPAEDRSVIRHAAADRLRVSDNQVEVTSYVLQGACYVAQITVKTTGDPAYSVAVRKQEPTPVVTRISGESLGSNSDPGFDTDDPQWESACHTSRSPPASA